MQTVLKLLLIIGAVLNAHNTFACICGREASEWSIETVKLNIEKSDLIFIGNLLSSEGDKYSFEVVEVFKGKVNSNIIHGEAMNGCSITPYIDGLWVIYTHVDEKGMFDLTFCNLSRSLITLTPGLPPPDVTKANDIADMTWNGKHLSVAVREWMQEYTMLISLKGEQFKVEPEEDTITQGNDVNTNSLLTYVAVALALIALLVAFLKK